MALRGLKEMGQTRIWLSTYCADLNITKRDERMRRSFNDTDVMPDMFVLQYTNAFTNLHVCLSMVFKSQRCVYAPFVINVFGIMSIFFFIRDTFSEKFRVEITLLYDREVNNQGVT